MAKQCTASIATLPISVAIRLFALSIAWIITGCDLLHRSPPPTAADYCNVEIKPADPGDTELKIWAPDARQHCLRLYAPVLAANGLNGISVTAVENNVNSGPFRTLLQKAIRDQNAPDLAYIHNGAAVRKLADEGYLHPIDKCNLSIDDWTNPIFLQREWAYPFELDMLMLFYSKRILRKLGWDQSRIEMLPVDIASGNITLWDLLTIARQAVDAGVVKKGFAYTVHENRFYSTMHVYKTLGGHYPGKLEHLSKNKNALLETYRYYEHIRDQRLMHPAISQPGFSNVTNRFAIRDALANGKILFSHTVVSEWKRIKLDHVQNESLLRENIGIALFPANKTTGSAMLSAMGSYVVFSEKATGKNNQDAACKVVQAVAHSNFLRQHATNTSQIAPESKSIWVPSTLPSFTLENIHHGNESHTGFLDFADLINDVTTLLANSEITAKQAVALTAHHLQQPAK